MQRTMPGSWQPAHCSRPATKFLLFLALLALLALSETACSEPAAERRQIEVNRLVGSDRAEIRVADVQPGLLELQLRRRGATPLVVVIPPGTYFAAQTGASSLVVLRRATVQLDDDEWTLLPVPVAATDMERPLPADNERFRLAANPPDGDLARLLPALPPEETFAVDQAAIWIVSNDACYDDLIAPKGNNGQPKALVNAAAAVRAMQIVEGAGLEVTNHAIWADRKRLAEELDGDRLAVWLESLATRARLERREAAAALGATDLLSDAQGIGSFARAATGRYLATSACSSGTIDLCERGEVTFWDARDLEPLEAGYETVGLHEQLVFSGDGRWLASAACVERERLACKKSEVWLWESQTHVPHLVLPSFDSLVTGLAFSPDGESLAVQLPCAERENQHCTASAIRLFSVPDGEPLHTLSGFVDPLGAMAFAPDGTLAASVCAANGRGLCKEAAVWLWDAASGELQRQLPLPLSLVWDLGFDASGRLFVNGTSYGGEAAEERLISWDPGETSPQELVSLPAEEHWCGNMAFSPDGQLLASPVCAGGRARSLQTTVVAFWDSSALERLAGLRLPPTAVDVAFDAGGTHLLSLSRNQEPRSLLFWELPSALNP